MYLPGEWIDPREIDWTSGFNPLRVPGWKKTNNRYAWNVMHDAYIQAIDKARGLEARIYLPEADVQVIQPGQTIDYEVPSEPNLWLYGINASCLPAVDGADVPTDFLFNVTNSQSGVALSTSPMPMRDFNATRSGTTDRGPMYLLATPQLFQSPAYPIIRMINVNPDGNDAAVPQILQCRVTLFCAVEYDQ